MRNALVVGQRLVVILGFMVVAAIVLVVTGATRIEVTRARAEIAWWIWWAAPVVMRDARLFTWACCKGWSVVFWRLDLSRWAPTGSARRCRDW